MISDRDYVGLVLEGSPYQPNAIERTAGERWLRETASGQTGTWSLVDIPSCRCCGDPAAPNLRCAKHQGRNPCAIDGCRRTTTAPGGGLRLADDGWMCAEHWRRHVPPHSKLRRAYHRFWRIAKREGWTPDLVRRFNRFWDGLVARARREATEGRLDMTEINKLFGWTDDEFSEP